MKALIAMSGGVDSSVAALLTKEKGIECIGCTMKLYEAGDTDLPPEKSKTCCSLDDTEDARSVAFRLGMPFYVFNYKDEFRSMVMDKFAHCYEMGATPNPCIDCNNHLKFGKLHERAEVLGCDFVVTGHYARIEKNAVGKYVLKKALDESKDQSYVLYGLTQKKLAHTLFPLGELTKAEARKIAEANGFVNAHKPDSQDICFVPDGDYASVVEKLTGKTPEPGDFVDKDGKDYIDIFRDEEDGDSNEYYTYTDDEQYVGDTEQVDVSGIFGYIMDKDVQYLGDGDYTGDETWGIEVSSTDGFSFVGGTDSAPDWFNDLLKELNADQKGYKSNNS